MRVLDKPNGDIVPNLWCIGDANGKMMLAHAASAHGVSAIENIIGNEHVVDHDAVPAACFTHPEVAFVGLNEEQAKVRAEEDGFELGKSVGHFRANSKALAEGEGDGIAKVREPLAKCLSSFGEHVRYVLRRYSSTMARVTCSASTLLASTPRTLFRSARMRFPPARPLKNFP